jgi:RHS repeat-associated protein
MSQRYTSYERDSNGGDEAQARRYQSRWTRFSQPDPFDGSYHMADPQSFNRYSYVGNDPVNHTDPSGLEECAYSVVSCIVEYQDLTVQSISGDFLSLLGPSFWGNAGPAMPIGPTPVGDPVGGGGNGGEPGQNPTQQENKDCYAFADEVERLLRTMPATQSSEVAGILLERFANSGKEFGSNGFRPEFADHNGTPNQARHYAGGFAAGFYGNEWVGSTLSAAITNAVRETTYIPLPLGQSSIIVPFPLPPNENQKVDRALNYAAAKHGGRMEEGKISPLRLADLIRKEICNPRP